MQVFQIGRGGPGQFPTLRSGVWAYRALTWPGGQGILEFLLVTGMNKIKDTVSDELQLEKRQGL